MIALPRLSEARLSPQVNQIEAETRMCGVGHTRAVPNLAIGLQDRRCDCLTQSCAAQSRLGETQSRQGEAFLRRPNKPPSAHILFACPRGPLSSA